MSDGTDWLMRPVLRGLCSYKDLVDCSLSLFDVSVMNEAIDIEIENSRRLEK